MKNLKIIVVISTAAFLFLLISWSGSLGFPLKGALSVLLIPLSLMALQHWKVTKSWKYTPWLFLAIQALPLVVVHSLDMEATQAALPTSFIVLLVSASSLIWLPKWPRILGLLPASMMVYLLLHFWFYPAWLQQIDFNRWSAKVKEPKIIEGAFMNEQGQTRMLPIEGKVWVVEFWFSTCANCYAEMPEFEKLREQYESKGLQFISIRKPIHYDEKVRDRIHEVERAFGSDAWVARDSSWAEKQGIGVYPSYAIIDQSGRMTHHGTLERIAQALATAFP